MEGKRLREEKEKEMKMKCRMEAKQRRLCLRMKILHLKWVSFRHWKAINAKLVTSVSDPLDTTVRIRTYSTLNTYLSPFGATDEPSIVLSANLRQKKDKSP